MIELKACGRCLGDMMIEEYLGDKELVCLQCGHRQPLAAVSIARQPAAAATR